MELDRVARPLRSPRAPAFRPALFVTLAVCVAPSAASAQLVPAVRLELTGGAGALLPGTDLVRSDSVPGGSVHLGGSFALGGTAALQLPGGFGVEGQLLWAPNAALEDASGTKASGADWLALTVDGVYRPPLPLLGSVLEPFLGAGLGVRRFFPDRPVASFVCPPGTLSTTCVPALRDGSDRSDFTAEGMVGTYVHLPGLWRVRVELRDYITSFEDRGGARLQSDVAVLGGLVLRAP